MKNRKHVIGLHHLTTASIVVALVSAATWFLFRRSLSVSLAVVAGPFAGPLVRGAPNTTLDWSMKLIWIAGPVLVAGIGAQFYEPLGPRVRLGIWTATWFIWCAFGVVSYLVALE